MLTSTFEFAVHLQWWYTRSYFVARLWKDHSVLKIHFWWPFHFYFSSKCCLVTTLMCLLLLPLCSSSLARSLTGWLASIVQRRQQSCLRLGFRWPRKQICLIPMSNPAGKIVCYLIQLSFRVCFVHQCTLWFFGPATMEDAPYRIPYASRFHVLSVSL